MLEQYPNSTQNPRVASIILVHHPHFLLAARTHRFPLGRWQTIHEGSRRWPLGDGCFAAWWKEASQGLGKEWEAGVVWGEGGFRAPGLIRPGARGWKGQQASLPEGRASRCAGLSGRGQRRTLAAPPGAGGGPHTREAAPGGRLFGV